ncbi:MAG: GGDEF domain-containing protein [Lachnospiraceae bacterium]|nr:GGDEF domain-containing protein [Lachnospiraceae bacterium]
MNITKYRVDDSEFQIYYGKASIRDNFYIVNADERFYHLVGKKSGFPIPELLHADDVASFLQAVECLDLEPQCLLVRFLTDYDNYRYVYMKMSYNGKEMSGFKSFDIEITDIMSITDRYKLCVDQMEKYRQLMSLHDGVFFEYSYSDDMLQIYEYFNGQSRRMFYKNLTQAMEEVQNNARFTDKQKEEFLSLGEMIHKRIDCFKTTLDAEVLIDYMQGVRLECSCAIFYKEDVHYKLVGLVHYAGENQPEKSYYLSENAKDPTTGILNKRAIHEYALERIQHSEKGGYLVLIDIDDFKQINDQYGHMFGDEVIAKTAEILRSVTHTRGMAGRFGGDEFMLVLENVPTEEDMRRIMKVIAKHADWAFNEKEGFKISFSCGISKFPEDGTTYEELFRKADGCLYIAKDKGKSRYIIYREELHGALLENNDSERSVGLKATISDGDKHVLLSNMILRLYREGKSAIPGVMKDMQTYFDIDGIAIYTGVDMHRTYSRGNYVNPIQSLSFIFEPGYLEQFDANDCYTESILSHLEKRSPMAYRMNVRQESSKFIQYLLKKDGRPEVVVSFDFFNRSPKFGVTDTGIMQTVGKLLAEVAIE